MSLGGATWEGEVQEELRALLRRLAEKAVKSERIKEDVILFWIDAYYYVDSVVAIVFRSSAALFGGLAREGRETYSKIGGAYDNPKL
jgi:hypothetical protein